MPREDLELKNRQSRLFQHNLSKELSPRHKLYKLRDQIHWERLEGFLSEIIKVKDLGREQKSLRVMVGATMLQAMYNYSDCLTCETLDENMYWQYFCGYEYWEAEVGVSETSLRRFRQKLGEEGFKLILKELAETGLRVGAYKKKDMASVIIDTTVQIKNVKHPHDA